MGFRGPADIDVAYPDPQTATDAIAALIGVGEADRGYGQPTPKIPPASRWQEIGHREWNQLRAAMGNINTHTGSHLTIQPIFNPFQQVLVEDGNTYVPTDGVHTFSAHDINNNGNTVSLTVDLINYQTSITINVGGVASLPTAYPPTSTGYYIVHDSLSKISAADTLGSVMSQLFAQGRLLGAMATDGVPPSGGIIRTVGLDGIPVIGYDNVGMVREVVSISASAAGYIALTDAIAGYGSINVVELHVLTPGKPYAVQSVTVQNPNNARVDIPMLVTTLDANRLLFDPAQMDTRLALTNQRTLKWSGNITHEFTVDFGTEDRARWFFNSGGSILVSADRLGGGGNTSPVTGTFTSGTLYPVSYPPAWSSFMDTYAVWVDPGVNAFAGVSQTYYRSFTAPYTGSYTFTYQADNELTLYVDDVTVGTSVSYNGLPSTSSITLAAGQHLLRFVAENISNNTSGAWIDNPAGWAVTISNTNSSVIWDSRTHAAAEVIQAYTFTSPQVYAVSSTAGDWNAFMNQHAVWVDPNEDTYVNVPQTRYRNLSVATAGTYTFTYAIDDDMTIYLDGVAVISANVSSSRYANTPPTAKIHLTAGNHVLRFDVLNVTVRGGWALTIADGVGNVIWDTRNHLPAESIAAGSSTSSNSSVSDGFISNLLAAAGNVYINAYDITKDGDGFITGGGYYDLGALYTPIYSTYAYPEAATPPELLNCPGVFPVTWSTWSTFMNQYAVWNNQNTDMYLDPSHWVASQDAIITPYGTFNNLIAPTNQENTVAVVGYNPITYVGGPSYTRTITSTVTYDLSMYNVLSYLINPSGSGANSWGEPPDNDSAEGVHLEYSTDNVSWTSIGYVAVGGAKPNVWTPINVTIPAGAKSASGVYLRYRQTGLNNPNQHFRDNWAMTFPIASTGTGNGAVTYSSYRLINPPYTGYYTLSMQGDATMYTYIDGAVINGSNGSYYGSPITSNVYLSADSHVIRFDTTGIDTNPAGWAATLADQHGSVVWDTRSYAAQETIDYTPQTFPGVDKQSVKSATYNTPNTSYSYTVPENVSLITVKVWGAGGGGSSDLNGVSRCFPGGAGAFIQATIPVIPGETLTVQVGGGGLAGRRGRDQRGSDCVGAGGGGATAIYRGTTPLIIAGAGGGSPSNNYRTDLDAGRGGCGGIDRGYPGTSCIGNGIAQGGLPNEGGTGGNGKQAGWLFGGDGGYDNPYDNSGINHGGKGGGTWGAAGGGCGYWGGGGGDAKDPDQDESRASCGGGGGSSYITPDATNVVGVISPDGHTAPMLADPDYHGGCCQGGKPGVGKDMDGDDGGQGLVVIYVINSLAPRASYNWVVQARMDNYGGLNRANGSLMWVKSTFSTDTGNTVIDGTLTSIVNRRKAVGVLNIAEPVFSTVTPLQPPGPPPPPPPPPDSCISGQMFFGLYAYDSKRWNGTPIAQNTVLIPTNVTWNNLQDVYNYFGLANTQPTSTTIDLSVNTSSAWVLSNDTAISGYTTFTGLAVPPNKYNVVAVVGYNPTANVTNGTYIRTIATAAPINLSGYDSISYYINSAKTGTWGESPDNDSAEGIHLEYSTDGANWTSIDYVAVDSIGYNVWTDRKISLPSGAKVSSGVYLRYRQSGLDVGNQHYRDNWAMTSMVAATASSQLIPNNWCTRQLACLRFPATGTWTITVTYSHAIWLWINQRLVMGADSGGGIYTATYTSTFTAGTKYAWQLDMEHEEQFRFGYPYRCTVTWKGPGVTQPTVIPASAFCYDPNNPPTTAAVVDQLNS